MFHLKNYQGKFSSGLLIHCITPLTFTASTNKTCSNLERCCLTRFHFFVIVALHKIPKFRLIQRCGIFEERYISGIVSVLRPKLCGSCAFSQNFHTRKLGETSVFYAVPCILGSIMHGKYQLLQLIISKQLQKNFPKSLHCKGTCLFQTLVAAVVLRVIT